MSNDLVIGLLLLILLHSCAEPGTSTVRRIVNEEVTKVCLKHLDHESGEITHGH